MTQLRKSSKYRGVLKRGRKYQAFIYAAIGSERVRTHLGNWPKEDDAALAHDRAALFFGEAVPLNRPRKARAAGPASPSELVAESHKHRTRTKTNPYRGVCWNPERERWMCVVRIAPGKYLKVAEFDRAEDAALGHDRVAIGLHGRQIELNFPKRRTQPGTIAQVRAWAHKLYKQRCTSAYRGVHLHSEEQKWRANIVVRGKPHHLGGYDTELEAAEAYDRAARQLLGRKAKLNFP